jgi:UDP-N-acetylglucosamine 1-carboxyvinyltransferase
VAAAAITGGDLTITHAITQHMSGILIAFQRLGVQTHIDHDAQTIHVPGTQDLSIHTKENGTIFDLKALQRPLFPPDLVHAAVVLALKSQGQAIFHNLMYEYSFFFVQELAKMKANIILANPVSVITTGPTDFQAADLMCSDIIQAAYGLLLACLAAEGTSTLTAIHPLFRRFPDIVEKFNSLGAQIELVEE